MNNWDKYRQLILYIMDFNSDNAVMIDYETGEPNCCSFGGESCCNCRLATTGSNSRCSECFGRWLFFDADKPFITRAEKAIILHLFEDRKISYLTRNRDGQLCLGSSSNGSEIVYPFASDRFLPFIHCNDKWALHEFMKLPIIDD